jgi:hypothetical protein
LLQRDRRNTVTEYGGASSTTSSRRSSRSASTKRTPRQLDAFYHDLLARDLSRSSVRRFDSVLHAALHRAVTWGMIPSNPADRATPPGLTGATTSAPAVTKCPSTHCGSQRHRLQILALAIILAAVTNAVEASYVPSDGPTSIGTEGAYGRPQPDGVAIEGPTKTHQRRDIALDDVLLGLFTKRRGDQEAYAGAVGTALAPDPFGAAPDHSLFLLEQLRRRQDGSRRYCWVLQPRRRWYHGIKRPCRKGWLLASARAACSEASPSSRTALAGRAALGCARESCTARLRPWGYGRAAWPCQRHPRSGKRPCRARQRHGRVWQPPARRGGRLSRACTCAFVI